jgi:hypothetical protein
MIQAQIQQQIHAVGRDENRRKASPVWEFPVHEPRRFHRTHLSVECQKSLRAGSEPKLWLAIPENHSLERHASSVPHRARPLCGNSQNDRQLYPFDGNFGWHKEVHKPAPRPALLESPDSAPVASRQRCDLVSPSAFYKYATPAQVSRQPDRRAAFRTANISIAVAVRILIDYHFSGKRAVHVGKISGRQNDANNPPRQSDL